MAHAATDRLLIVSSRNIFFLKRNTCLVLSGPADISGILLLLVLLLVRSEV